MPNATSNFPLDTTSQDAQNVQASPRQRTAAEISDLKDQWKEDPIWDLRNTEGFEAHKHELGQFEADTRAGWTDDADKRLRAKAESFGVPDKLELVAYVMGLERRLANLESRFS